MPRILNLYVDDSGSRHPDKVPGHSSSQWFGLGGILLAEEEKERVEARYDAFRARWAERLGDHPLHSWKIRQKKAPFRWLLDPAIAQPFFEDLTELIMGSPLLCSACVIDREGYLARYIPKYDRAKRWQLCKTAFCVLLERTAKYARQRDYVVRVHVERSDKVTDRSMNDYFEELRRDGLPFDAGSMARYAPLTAADFRRTLYDFRLKDKQSGMMQLADLCLYPVCNAGFRADGRDYRAFVDNKKLIDSVLAPEDVATVGIKYSCFDAVGPAAGRPSF